MNTHPKPDMQTMQRVEALLREQLDDLGVDITRLPPHEITEHMHCAVYADGTLSYSWQGKPVLSVEPDAQDEGSIHWRFYTRPEPVQ